MKIYCVYDSVKYGEHEFMAECPETFLPEYIPVKLKEYDSNCKPDILVKGLVNSDDFLRLVLKYHNKDKHFLSHVFVLSKDSESFMITDAVLNQFPTLEQRLNIAINAYDFASSYNVENKNLSIGFLNHSGHFNIKNKTACESELLSEAFNQYKPLVIAQTGQLDILLSKDSRRIKGIADYGSANIIVVNDINEGNSLVKAYMLNGWNCMGYVLGADIPIILNSRSNLNVEKSVKFLLDNGIIQ